MITFVGDVHGKFSEFRNILRKYNNVVQLGDLGIGFGILSTIEDKPFRFIHGNHDNPDICKEMPQFLGRYGYNGEFFFVSGAFSIDRSQRIIGRDWWENEELSYPEATNVISLVRPARPNIIISHDCPLGIYPHVSSHHIEDTPSLTSRMLQIVFEQWQPEYWLFGHHHVTKHIRAEGTKFICIGELDTYSL